MHTSQGSQLKEHHGVMKQVIWLQVRVNAAMLEGASDGVSGNQLTLWGGMFAEASGFVIESR